ncbi:unnamed protein product [Symbiodinium natans]|uniref:Uncharacterized protein n=1 Tax=Symbiodinium natans TaxID=878477 RepID=A0A812SFA5_9DINO|nr:unnamed protein product [Symbiodinium natans]
MVRETKQDSFVNGSIANTCLPFYGIVLSQAKTGALGAGSVSVVAVSLVGFAFNRPCTSPQGQAIGYTGCFDWSDWLLSMLAILAAFVSIGFIEHATSAAICAISKHRVEGISALAVLEVFCLACALAALCLLAKPWETYQTYEDGRTKSVDEWSIDVWMVFLGYSAVFAFGALATALALVLRNVLVKPWQRDSGDMPDVETSSDGSGSRSDASYTASSTASTPLVRSRSFLLAFVLAFLWSCFLFTAVVTPIWNFSMNSYFKSVSQYALFYWPVGELPCSLLDAEASCVGNGLCREISHWLPGFQPGVDACPWFSLKPFPDCVLYYGFLTLCVLCGAVIHTKPLSWPPGLTSDPKFGTHPPWTLNPKR